MPIYEYECEKCGGIFEAFQNFSDKPLEKCDQCSGRLHKIISQSTFHLKGTGWYVTDYAGKKQDAGKHQKQSDTTASTDSGTAKSTKTETKSGSGTD